MTYRENVLIGAGAGPTKRVRIDLQHPDARHRVSTSDMPNISANNFRPLNMQYVSAYLSRYVKIPLWDAILRPKDAACRLASGIQQAASISDLFLKKYCLETRSIFSQRT